MTHPFCKLCLTNEADKTNSHIIPKFMCKGLFESTKPRHAVMFNKELKGRKVQDVPKENHILCSPCEKRIEIVETYFAKIINDIHNYKSYPQKFILSRIGTQDYIKCNELDPILFKMFLYSLIWRASISNLYEYEPFKLEADPEELIRRFLNNNLASSKQLLLHNAATVMEIPKYHSCIIKPIVKGSHSRGVLSIASMSKTAHALFLIDFAIFFYTDETSIGNVLINYSNKENKDVIVALGQQQSWTQLNQLFVTKMVNSKNGG